MWWTTSFSAQIQCHSSMGCSRELLWVNPIHRSFPLPRLWPLAWRHWKEIVKSTRTHTIGKSNWQHLQLWAKSQFIEQTVKWGTIRRYTLLRESAWMCSLDGAMQAYGRIPPSAKWGINGELRMCWWDAPSQPKKHTEWKLFHFWPQSWRRSSFSRLCPSLLICEGTRELLGGG